MPAAAAVGRRVPVLGLAMPLGAAVLLLGALTWPLVFTHSGFEGDWEHQLWLMWHQSLSLQSNHAPSLFLNSAYSVFYPSYAFYGGTLFTVGGLLSLALGGAPVTAYVLVYMLDFAAAFGGWYWLARMAGVDRWAAMVPGLVFVTSAYYILIAYIQGDWPELTGISMIPLLAAAALSVLYASRLRLGPALALALSSLLFFGSHNITILLGLTTLALFGIVIHVCVPAARRRLTPRGIARVAIIVVPAALVSAWYLLPALVYDSRTGLGAVGPALPSLRASFGLLPFESLFTLSRTSFQLPVLALAWVIAGLLVLPWGAARPPWTRVSRICAAITVLILLTMTHAALWMWLPAPYTLIQFSYRLEMYALLALCATIVALLALARGRSVRARAWRWTVVPVCAVSLIAAVQQLAGLHYPGQDRYEALESYGQVETGNNRDFQDVSAPVLSGRRLPAIDIPPEAIHHDRVAFQTRLASGSLLATNIGAGSYLVHVTGAKPVATDAATGDMVLRVGSADGTITVSAGRSLPIVLGRVLSLLAIAVLGAELLVLSARRLRRPRARASEPGLRQSSAPSS
jgi:hypothetical protein